MTEKSFSFTLTAPRGDFPEEEVTYLMVPAVDGLMGFCADHSPIAAALAPGIVSLKNGSGEKKIRIAGGVLRFEDNKAVILTRKAEIL